MDVATHDAGWNLGLSYASLPGRLFERRGPTPVRSPRLVVLNGALATRLGLDPVALAGEAGAAIFAGNALPPGADPIAQAYGGHQYGNFVVLGDGRALLLGEQVAPDGARFDVALKGSGRTAFSRGGDGRAALGPMLREHLVSEAMHALGIPTTRALAVAATGEGVPRREGLLPGGVLTRVAASHLRVGTFEWAAAHEDREALEALVAFALGRHPEGVPAGLPPAEALLRVVVARQASLVARWMLVGFVHGVMNTDNMAISGETIDYGPCAFLDAYEPDLSFSSIDRHGRYAYGNQPSIARWNLARLAESLLPLLGDSEERALAAANDAIAAFGPAFHAAWLGGMRAKLGILGEEAGDVALVEDLLAWMQATRADFTRTFVLLGEPGARRVPPFADPGFASWHARWVARLGRDASDEAGSLALMRSANPVVVPRNHRVEAVLSAAVAGDLGPYEQLLGAVTRPFAPPGEHAGLDLAPPPTGTPRCVTFCGT